MNEENRVLKEVMAARGALDLSARMVSVKRTESGKASESAGEAANPRSPKRNNRAGPEPLQACRLLEAPLIYFHKKEG